MDTIVTHDYAPEIFVCPTSTALALFKLDSLFSDYVSTQMAEGRDEGNNHPRSLAVVTLSSHVTGLIVLQKFSLHSTKLACVYSYVARSLKGSSASKTLQVGQASSWSTKECLVALVSSPFHVVTPSRGLTA